MKIDLRKYLEERDHMHRSLLRDGPVLTVSRAYGCEANRLVRLLIHRINELGPGALKKHQWKYISKEVIDECAFELGINPMMLINEYWRTPRMVSTACWQGLHITMRCLIVRSCRRSRR